MKNKRILKLTYSAVCIALAFALPFLTWNNQQLGNMFSLMHVPVLLCGFICGWPWGLCVGIISPLLRSLIIGMPPLFPTAVAMAVELAVYGLLAGLLYKIFPKKNLFIYISLAAAMIGGRIAGGAAQFIIAGIKSTRYSIGAFFTSYFANAIPGIVLHIILVPLIVMALRNEKLMANE